MAKKKKRDIGKIATRVIAAILALMFVISIVATFISTSRLEYKR